MITMDLREAIQLQSVYGPGTGAYALVADLGQARDSVLAFLTAPLSVAHEYDNPEDHARFLAASPVTFYGEEGDEPEALDAILAFLCAPIFVRP